MRADWLTLLHGKLVVAGILLGTMVPAIFTFVVIKLSGNSPGLPTLTITLLTVFGGSLVSAWQSETRNGRLLNSLLVAFSCAIISLIASVLANPLSGGNFGGILFLLVSYGLMGFFGGEAAAVLAKTLATHSRKGHIQ